MKNIKEHKYKDCVTGLDITEIIVGDCSTKIAQWKDTFGTKKKVQLSLNTTPKCRLIETNRDFDSVKEAKKFYLDNLKIFLEDTLELLKGVDYTNKRNEVKNDIK